MTVQLRQLSIGQSIAIASMPEHFYEAECSAFLRAAVQTVQGVEDPADWTVQERMLAICHYLAVTSEGDPDFALGNGHYSDYLDAAADIPMPVAPVEVGELKGDVWQIQHLTGRMAESIERMAGEVSDAYGNPLSSRMHWIVGGMAAQMVRAGETTPKPNADSEKIFDEFLVNRMKVITAYPENDFVTMMLLYFGGGQKLHHLFKTAFNDEGIVAMPKGGEAVQLPPARFPVRSCLNKITLELVSQPHGSGI